PMGEEAAEPAGRAGEYAELAESVPVGVRGVREGDRPGARRGARDDARDHPARSAPGAVAQAPAPAARAGGAATVELDSDVGLRLASDPQEPAPREGLVELS